MRCVLITILISIWAGLATGPAAARADALDDWAEVYLRALKAENTSPALGSRNMAIFALAVADVVDAAEPRWGPYLFTARVTEPVDVEAAIAAAARDTGVALFPSRRAEFNSLWERTQSGLGTNVARQAGHLLGFASAAAHLKVRAADGSNTRAPYIPTNAPGAWRRTPPYFRPPDLPHWQRVRPFALREAAQFRPPGPPALASERFAQDYILTHDFGGKKSAARTADQTVAARFWSDFTGTATPPGHWAQITLALARSNNLALPEKVRLFALVQTALADAGIACWDAKFTFNFWRPITACRGVTGNPRIVADPDWAPLLVNPSFPEYVSGHSTFSGAAAEVLRRWFGRDDLQFTISSDTLPGVTRHFTSLKTAVDEIGMSRIWGGIHFHSADADGQELGRKVGDWTFDHVLRVTGAQGPRTAP